jgi:4-oxalocrotonate tautomerase
MPYISITISARRDGALAERIAARISALTAEHLRKDPGITAISVAFQDPDLWFVGGRSLQEQGKVSFWLDIKVVDGSNTKSEMAAYLEAVFVGMGQLLGEVHPESYVLVHEVPAAAYGYGGVTQEHRFIAGRMALA